MIYTHYLNQNTLLLLNQNTVASGKNQTWKLTKTIKFRKKTALEKATEKVTFFYLLTASKLVSEIMN